MNCWQHHHHYFCLSLDLEEPFLTIKLSCRVERRVETPPDFYKWLFFKKLFPKLFSSVPYYPFLEYGSKLLCYIMWVLTSQCKVNVFLYMKIYISQLLFIVLYYVVIQSKVHVLLIVCNYICCQPVSDTEMTSLISILVKTCNYACYA